MNPIHDVMNPIESLFKKITCIFWVTSDACSHSKMFIGDSVTTQILPAAWTSSATGEFQDNLGMMFGRFFPVDHQAV